MGTKINPTEVLELMVEYGRVERVSDALGLHPRSLWTVARRNWHVQFAIEAGQYIRAINKARRFREISAPRRERLSA